MRRFVIVERGSGRLVAEGCRWRNESMTVRTLGEDGLTVEEEYSGVTEAGIWTLVREDTALPRARYLVWLDSMPDGIAAVARARAEARLRKVPGGKL